MLQMSKTKSSVSQRGGLRGSGQVPLATTGPSSNVQSKFREGYTQIVEELGKQKLKIDTVLKGEVPAPERKRLLALGNALGRLLDQASALERSILKSR